MFFWQLRFFASFSITGTWHTQQKDNRLDFFWEIWFPACCWRKWKMAWALSSNRVSSLAAVLFGTCFPFYVLTSYMKVNRDDNCLDFSRTFLKFQGFVLFPAIEIKCRSKKRCWVNLANLDTHLILTTWSKISWFQSLSS